VTSGSVDSARLPPADLDGLDPAWSRLVTVPTTDSSDGVRSRTWHLLDNRVESPTMTLLCVHGNPSWSYLWRNVMADAPAGIRVIAVDQLGMGYSERTGSQRPLATRVDDLCDLTHHLRLDGSVVTVAHDWGGPISLGWAQRHLHQMVGVVLLNTAVHQPKGSPAPGLIRLARHKAVLNRVTVDTTAFIDGALAMSRPRPEPEIRRGFRAPYDLPTRRESIADFVSDIPLDSGHPSAVVLDDIADNLSRLSEVPALLLWGPADKVFSDRYLHDLERRLPHADVHRFVGAGHFVSEDADVSEVLYDWLAPQQVAEAEPVTSTSRRPVWSGLDRGGIGDRPAVIEMTAEGRSISFGELGQKVDAVAAGLLDNGVCPGDRVALMVPPSIDLTVALYACWKLGAVVVLIDSGLGPKGMSRACASAAPDHLVGVTRALVAAKTLGWPGRRFSVVPLGARQRRLLDVVTDLETLASGQTAGAQSPGRSIELPDDDDVAAVVFTSGATGPSKGVLYRHRQLQAQRDALMELYQVSADDRLVAAFAPFALYGPAMSIASVVPDMDVAAPGTLTARSLGEAVLGIDATLVFASPAALVNVVKTQAELSSNHRAGFEKVRLVLSAGAPVRASLLRDVVRLFPNAEAHTPYGMTETLPVANITLTEIEGVSGGDGVCVGYPLPTVEVRISSLDHLGVAVGDLSKEPGVMGEIVVRAPHVRDGYDRLWHIEHCASQPPGWHRSGDVGHLDDDGRLWIGGRLGHVVTAPTGPVTPVGIEQSIEDLAGVTSVAVVGVGPAGTQHLVAVVQPSDNIRVRRPRLADLELHDLVRSRTHHDIVAVLVVSKLPVDRRHNSKIDRTQVAKWADRVLAGGRIGRL